MGKNPVQLTTIVSAIKTRYIFGTYLVPTHVFFMETKNGIILFDTGGPGSGQLILDGIKKTGHKPESIRAICISHWHGDHTGSLGEILEIIKPLSPIDIFIGKKDLPFLKEQQARILRIHPLFKLPVMNRPGLLPCPDHMNFIPLDTEGCDKLLCKYSITAIPTPGHTPGHTAFFHKPSQSLFSGCALSIIKPNVAGLVPVFHDRAMQIRSAKQLAALDFLYLFPVHMVLEKNKIPLQKRRPCVESSGFFSILAGSYSLFKW